MFVSNRLFELWTTQHNIDWRNIYFSATTLIGPGTLHYKFWILRYFIPELRKFWYTWFFDMRFYICTPTGVSWGYKCQIASQNISVGHMRYSKLTKNLTAWCNMLDLPKFRDEMSQNSKFGYNVPNFPKFKMKSVFIAKFKIKSIFIANYTFHFAIIGSSATYLFFVWYCTY